MKSDNPFSLGDDSSADQLKAIVLELESLEDDAEAIREQKRTVRKEAKDRGFDLPTITDLLKRRRLTPDEVIEADALLETYEIALGCGAAAVGVMSATRDADGVFQVKMIAAPPEQKLTKAAQTRRAAVAMAELARQARDDLGGR